MWLPRLDFLQNLYKTRPPPPPPQKDKNKHHSISILYLSGESSKNMTSRFSSNSPTPSDRDWSTPRTKHQGTNRATSWKPYSARKNATNCTLGNLNSPSINVWHNAVLHSLGQNSKHSHLTTHRQSGRVLTETTLTTRPTTPR